jgi:hypothetical protein
MKQLIMAGFLAGFCLSCTYMFIFVFLFIEIYE